MCKLFADNDAKLWENRTRTLHLDGTITNIRLENSFWRILESIAQKDGLTLPVLITRLYELALQQGHNMNNFTSFLRFCCIRFQEMQFQSHHAPAPQNAAPKDTTKPSLELVKKQRRIEHDFFPRQP